MSKDTSQNWIPETGDIWLVQNCGQIYKVIVLAKVERAAITADAYYCLFDDSGSHVVIFYLSEFQDKIK